MAVISYRAWFSVCLIVLCSLSTTTNQVFAAGFSPAQIIDDATFTNNRSMSVVQIQRFLESKGSILAHAPASQLGDGSNGRSAAQIIYDSTRGSRTDFAIGNGFGRRNPLKIAINPAVILVTLQKEQSLVTGKYSLGRQSTHSALQFAMGYGCPDTAGCAAVYAGFTNQVVYASAQLSRNVALANRSIYPPGRITVFRDQMGSQLVAHNVMIANAATSALYQYTPHVYYGNYNFRTLMNIWFPSAGPYRTYVA